METESVEETTKIGDYMVSLVPNRYSTALICVHDITMSGHTVIFTNTATIVEDIGGTYSIHIPRIPLYREWRTPSTSSTDSQHSAIYTPHQDTAAPGPDAHRMTSTATKHSARIHEIARSTVTRVKRLHDRMGHKPAAVMCRAVNTTWRNTGVTPADIGRVFY